MKKAKIKLNNFDVDGPFLKARTNILDFGESMRFMGMVQATVVEIKTCEEEYELALFMDDLDLAAKKKKEIDALTRSLVFAAGLLENESGIDA